MRMQFQRQQVAWQHSHFKSFVALPKEPPTILPSPPHFIPFSFLIFHASLAIKRNWYFNHHLFFWGYGLLQRVINNLRTFISREGLALRIACVQHLDGHGDCSPWKLWRSNVVKLVLMPIQSFHRNTLALLWRLVFKFKWWPSEF